AETPTHERERARIGRISCSRGKACRRKGMINCLFGHCAGSCLHFSKLRVRPSKTREKEKAEPRPRLIEIKMRQQSALGELEGATGLGLAVLLAFDNARIASQETALLENRTQTRF